MTSSGQKSILNFFAKSSPVTKRLLEQSTADNIMDKKKTDKIENIEVSD